MWERIDWDKFAGLTGSVFIRVTRVRTWVTMSLKRERKNQIWQLFLQEFNSLKGFGKTIKTTDPLFAPATAWLRKEALEEALHIPSEKPVTLGLNSFRMSARLIIKQNNQFHITNAIHFLFICLFKKGKGQTYWAKLSQWWGCRHRRCWIKQIFCCCFKISSFALLKTSLYSLINDQYSMKLISPPRQSPVLIYH